uniref:thimet oligopeptidase-like n=1 Tax=Styela clava TaxID=7725 RepID=UPI00193969C7|nr:thimet oligopeptidase-like [Styela clava]
MLTASFIKVTRSVVSLIARTNVPTFQNFSWITLKKRNFSTTKMPAAAINKETVLKHLSLKWDMTAPEIGERAEKLIETTRALYDKIGNLDLGEVTFENTIKPIADSDCTFSVERCNLDFYQSIHPDKALRDASTECDKKLSDFEIETSMRQDIYDRIVAFEEKSKDMKLSDETRRFITRMNKLGQRNGLRLPKNEQEKVMAIKKRQTEIEIDFQKNLNEENSTWEFSEEELKGLPKDLLNELEKTSEGKFKLSLKYPHYFPLMKKCSVESTRKKMEIAFNSRCKEENSAILTELVKLRAEKAKILNFSTHAAFIHDMRMAKNPENVKSFLQNLAAKLKPLGEYDRKEMLKLKEKECKELGVEFDGKINMWDLRYYMTKIEETKFAVDQEKLKQYFPLHVVTDGLLEIYQELLGLKFNKVEGVTLWHEEVTMYTVTDKVSENIIGIFYLDLYPREGKYGHAACFGLQPGCLKPDGKRQLAVAAMVANFSKPTADAPSLLQHSEVETYFHEFGHVMHQICSETEYQLFSGTNVERDFVEAPSQMLENWCWEHEAVKRMSKHYKDGSEIPSEMMDSLVKSRNANIGVFLLRQITLATLDLNIHTRDSADIVKVYADACDSILGIPASEGTCMPATFGHLGGGYDAQYYGYLWSEVFCYDMYHSRFKSEGIFDTTVGRDYREKILKPGGSKDASEMLRNFLGRDPTQAAFLKAKGLAA